MAIEFMLDENGNMQKDAATGLYLVKRDGNTEPLDMDRLYGGAERDRREAADFRHKFNASETEKASLKAKLEEMATEVERFKSGDKGQESEELRRIKALEDALKRSEQEKNEMSERTERRESSQRFLTDLEQCQFVAEHAHIPVDLLFSSLAPLAYNEIYGSPASYEEYNGVKQWVFKDKNGKILESEKHFGQPAELQEALLKWGASRAKPGDIKLNPAPYGGTGSQQPQRYGMASNPWNKGKENVTMQHKIMAEDPALAQRLQAQAGV